MRSEITSVFRVAHVLLLRLVAGNMDVNTLASKRSQLIGNTAIVRKRCVIHKKSTCVCLRLSVAAFTRKRRDARFDLWPALEIPKVAQLIGTCLHSLDEGHSPSKLRVSTPALLYKELPQSYQDGQYICMIVV